MPIMIRADSIVKVGAGEISHKAHQSPFQAKSFGFCCQDSTENVTRASEKIADRIGQFLVNHRPALFCDDCIAEKLGLSHRRQANRITAAFGTTPTFWRDVGACFGCGKHKQVIRHV